MNKYSAGFILITLTISIIVYIINKPTHVEYMGDTSIYDLKKFREGLKQIKLNQSKFSNLYELYELVGKSRSEIESKYPYIKSYNTNVDNGKFAHYYLDECVIIFYKDNIVNQVATGEDGTHYCFEEKDFSKENRLNLLGKEDLEDRFTGMPGFGEYFYLSKGFSLIKQNSKIWQFWFTKSMTMEEYRQTFYPKRVEDRQIYRINTLLFSHPETDDQGRVLPATPEI